MEAGIDDVGIGALMGLYDWRFEVLGLLSHTLHLEERFGVGPHTISFPRIEPAVGTVFADRPPQRVPDADFMKLVAILRLAVPYTGLILTCRESIVMRNAMLEFGVSQIDGGSNIGIGAYAAEAGGDAFVRSQFKLGDQRTLDEVIAELCRAEMIPSFCTSCYRMGRTGQHFMEFAVPGFVKQFCTPNAVLTFLEYLLDYAGPETRQAGFVQIDRELARIPPGAPKDRLISAMEQIRAGERDLCY
jgi:2-iminoacetate synthase